MDLTAQQNMSTGQQEDYDAEDALTTEEELFLKHETMREFIVNQLNDLRESVFSVQKMVQEDVKACMESTELKFREELQHDAEKTQKRLQCDLQLLKEIFNNALQKVEAKQKAMEELVVTRMATVEGKMESVLSRISTMEMDVCSMLVSSVADTPKNQMDEDMVSDGEHGQTSVINQTLLSTPVSCMLEQKAETSVDIQPPSPSHSLIEPTQSATFTLTRRRPTTSLPVQPAASSQLLSSMQGHKADTSFDIRHPSPSQSPIEPTQGATFTLTRRRPTTSLPVQPSASSQLLSSMQGHEADTSFDIQPPSPSHSLIEPTQGATFTLTRCRPTASLPVQPSASSQLLSSMQGHEAETTVVDLQSPPLTSGYQQQVDWTRRKLSNSLEDLQPDIAAKVKPYMSQKITKQEKMSRLQVAYFHYQIERLKVKNTKGLYDKADVIREAGERDGLWSPGWSPRGSKDMKQFLVEKIKTTLKKRRKSDMVVEEEKRALQKKLKF